MKANLQAVGMQARLNGSSDSILAASEEERPNDFSGSEVAATGHVRPNESHECGWQPMVTLNRIKRVVAGWLLVDMLKVEWLIRKGVGGQCSSSNARFMVDVATGSLPVDMLCQMVFRAAERQPLYSSGSCCVL